MRRSSLLVLLLTMVVGRSSAQGNIAGNWQGTILFGTQAQRVGLVLERAAAGYGARFVIIDQDNATAVAQQVTLAGNTLRLEIPAFRASFEGTLNAAGDEIAGALNVGGPVPVTFKRVAALDQPATFGEPERAAVVATIEGYFATFTANDFVKLGSLLQVPFTRMPSGGAANVVSSLDELMRDYRTTRRALDGTDYSVSRAVAMVITPTSASSAMVDLHWRRDKKDGSLLQEGAEIPMVVKTLAGWKVNGNLGRALSQYGKTF